MKDARNRYEDLECIRGLAALTVVAYHFSLAFLPDLSDTRILDGQVSLGPIAVSPPFMLAPLNGQFAVSLFFVLSSYVLTQRILHHGVESPATVAIPILKRWPRLLLLTLVGNLIGFSLLAAGLTFNAELAQINGSVWLKPFAGIAMVVSDPSFAHAAFEGALATFVTGDSHYNASLWTMKYELVGSVLALALAGVLAGPTSPWRDLGATFLVGTAAVIVHPLCALCVVTVLAAKYIQAWRISLPMGWAIAALIAALALGSIHVPSAYLRDSPVPAIMKTPYTDWTIMGAAALLLFLAVHASALSRGLRGPLARVLGRLSFPIYVLHAPLIVSLGAFIVLTHGGSASALVLAAAAVLSVTLLLSFPLAWLDEAWVRLVNRAAGRLRLSRREPAEGPVPGSDAP